MKNKKRKPDAFEMWLMKERREYKSALDTAIHPRTISDMESGLYAIEASLKQYRAFCRRKGKR